MSPRRLTDRPWDSDTERRRAFVAVAMVLFAVTGGLIALKPSSGQRRIAPPAHTSTLAPAAMTPGATTATTTLPPPPPQPPPASNPAPSQGVVNRTQDAQNRDPRFRARLARDLRQRPAFQHLPYHASGVVIDLAGSQPDGRLILTVAYHGSLADARGAYRRFLARYRDPGGAYHPVYRHQP